MNIHIVDEVREHSIEEEYPHGHIYVTPDEAVGEIVEVEFPGTMGKEPYEIVEFNGDETVLKHVMTGKRGVITDDTFYPDPDILSIPPLGKEYEIWKKEHLNGRGEWVETISGPSSRYVQEHYGKYEGHEKTRVIRETFKFLPEGFVSNPIYVADGEVKSYANENLDGWKTLVSEVDPKNDTHSRIQAGQFYYNIETNEIVKYEIERMFRSDDYVGFYDKLENPAI